MAGSRYEQAHELQAHIKATGIAVDLVVTSTLTRALETAVGCFGSHSSSTDRLSEAAAAAAAAPALLMAELPGHPGKQAPHPAVSAVGVPKMMAHELCREHLGVHPCDKRHPLSTKLQMFPAVDFSLVTEQHDPLWTLHHRETKEEICARGMQFLQWVMSRPERNIAIVSHSSFLHFMLTNFGHHDSTMVQGELHKWFENCELRSVVLVDHGALQSRQDPYHYAGYPATVKEGPEV
eukprot:jgi/Chrzof1/7627/Cz02g30220.t1